MDMAKINGIIRTAIAVLSGALIGAGFDVGGDFGVIGANADAIIGALMAAVTAGWSIYNKVAHKEEVVQAAATGKVEVKA